MAKNLKHKAYKFRIYPTEDQIGFIERSFGVRRLLYNLTLDVIEYRYRAGFRFPSYYELCKEVKDLREDHEWIQEVDSQSLYKAVKDAHEGYFKFFNDLKAGRKTSKPKFKKRGVDKDTFCCPCNKREVDFDRTVIHTPKLKNIPFADDGRRFEGNIKQITFSKNSAGQYFASVLVQEGELPKKKDPKNIKESEVVGVDLGLKDLYTTSEGKKANNPKHYRKAEKRLKWEQRKLSRKEKGSNNHTKQKRKVAKKHLKVKNQREDTLHKASSALVRGTGSENQVPAVLALETLSPSNMVKNRSLSKSIQDVGWSKFVDMIAYKCEWEGVHLVKMDRFYPSSKTCSECGHFLEELDLSTREWACPSCGVVHDRDENAGQNLKAKSLEVLKEKVGRQGGPEPINTPVDRSMAGVGPLDQHSSSGTMQEDTGTHRMVQSSI